MPEDQTEVLVVGAGPVGLLTALVLAEAGIEVRIIDHEERTTARSYACALHPGTLRVLSRFGLAAPLVERGRRLKTVAFYEGQTRRAELQLAQVGGDFPFLLVLPQNVLEEVLEDRLRQVGVQVQWNHRFDSFEDQREFVDATIEKLGGTSTGYIVPHWEKVVKNRRTLRAQFLVGADGANSLVRARLGIEHERFGTTEFFAAFEFGSDQELADEVCVVLDAETTNVLWPLTEHRCRWTFQLIKSEVSSEFPEKERRATHFVPKQVDQALCQRVQKFAAHRAPWFTAGVKEVFWCTDVAFDHRLAGELGSGRCWLAGDAAHQTGPVGAQSMNVGLAEATDLAAKLQGVLRQGRKLGSLKRYGQERRTEWRRLLGQEGGLIAGNDTPPWVRDRRTRLLSCLPGAGEDLVNLAGQLKLTWK
jgi:2-polyprenyl-6-methoxyphenol hydroxylase-like FAD-dependent oxidoreductase